MSFLWFGKKRMNKDAEALFESGETMPLNIVAKTDVGCVREANEDNYWISEEADENKLRKRGRLALVADGMGGHAAGEVASGMAAEIINEEYYDSKENPHTALVKAVVSANKKIFERQRHDPNLSGMGTTCTALVILGDNAFIAHVGDSRCYLVRGDGIYLMSEDHSLVMEMVRLGMLDKESARKHPEKNVILRAVGTKSDVEVYSWNEPFKVRDGDVFLLCSDGLYDLVTDDEILSMVKHNDALSAIDQLIALAKQRGGHDNITVALIEIGDQQSRNKSNPNETLKTREVKVLQ